MLTGTGERIDDGQVLLVDGRIAAVGDTVAVDGGTLSVTRMDGRRIDRICFKPAAAATNGSTP